jgi:hypothetical protein
MKGSQITQIKPQKLLMKNESRKEPVSATIKVNIGSHGLKYNDIELRNKMRVVTTAQGSQQVQNSYQNVHNSNQNGVSQGSTQHSSNLT